MNGGIEMNRSEVMKAAWQYRKADGLTMSAALKRAWAEAFLDSLDFGIGPAPAKASKPLVLDLRFSGDVGKLRGMFASEVKKGIIYDYRIA
jgi:hypothetical protein